MVLGGDVGVVVVVLGGAVVAVLGGAVDVRFPTTPSDRGVERGGSASQAIPSLSGSRLEGSVWSLSYHSWASS